MAGGYGWSHSEDQLLASLNARSFKNFPAPIGLETAPGLHTLDSVCRVQCKNGNPSFLRADNIGVFGNLVTSLQIGRHTSELQSPYDLVCRLLLEKKERHTCQLACTPPPYRSSGLSRTSGSL